MLPSLLSLILLILSFSFILLLCFSPFIYEELKYKKLTKQYIKFIKKYGFFIEKQSHYFYSDIEEHIYKIFDLYIFLEYDVISGYYKYKVDGCLGSTYTNGVAIKIKKDGKLKHTNYYNYLPQLKKYTSNEIYKRTGIRKNKW